MTVEGKPFQPKGIFWRSQQQRPLKAAGLNHLPFNPPGSRLAGRRLALNRNLQGQNGPIHLRVAVSSGAKRGSFGDSSQRGLGYTSVGRVTVIPASRRGERLPDCILKP